MKKYLLLIFATVLLSACTIRIDLPNTSDNDYLSSEYEQTDSTNDSDNIQVQQSEPAPEPTQEFIDDNASQATAQIDSTPKPNMASHDDIIGLWLLVVWNSNNINELVFYEITTGMMNVMPYGNNSGYSDMNYTYRNGVVDFGNGSYDAIFDQNVLVLTSQSAGTTIVFQPVTEDEMKSMTGTDQITDGSVPNGPFTVVPTGPSGRQGYPHYLDESVVQMFDPSDFLSQLCSCTWYTYGYQWNDGTIVHDFAAYSEFTFNSDYSFILNHSLGSNTGLYEMSGNSLELFYSDGTTQYYSELFMEMNQSTGYAYLYISDPQEGYEGCYTVYEGY